MKHERIVELCSHLKSLPVNWSSMNSFEREFYLLESQNAIEQERNCSVHVLPSLGNTTRHVECFLTPDDEFRFGNLKWKLGPPLT